MRLVLLGRPGVGKGSYAKELSKIYNLKHISTGDIFRDISAKETDLGKQINRLLEEGKLVPTDLVNQVVEELLPGDDFILDGYPRTVEQAIFLQTIRPPDFVIYPVVPTKIIFERLKGRGRGDDRAAIIKKRLEEYELNTAPVVTWYEGNNVLLEVDGTGTIPEVTDRIVKLIDNYQKDWADTI